MMNRYLRCFSSIGKALALLMFCGVVSHAFADGEPRAAATPNQASDASFDKRLPPVLPGERVSDNGKTMRVWSTAGSVTESLEAEVIGTPPTDSSGERNSDQIAIDGVIVDHRR